ncbi:MAG: transporter [Verrucomicrobiae bacterium]|nr:transporter [Verrucomicrobiae bacterium]
MNHRKLSLLSGILATSLSLPFSDRLAAQEDAPPVVAEVTATESGNASFNNEEVGAYNQPEWVKHRRFANTRVHIQRDPWEMALEHWWRGRLNDGEWKHRFQEELEIGLPGRIQLDLYEDWVVEDGEASHHDVAFEVRYGLADWGVIPLNPALYFEYKWVDPDHGGDVIEPKILLGDEFGDGWNYGLNLVYEREMGGENTEEFQVTQGLSKALLNDAFSLGVEAKYVRETVEGSRGNPEHKVLLGPSVQFRPADNMHLDVVALAGLTNDSPDLEAWVVFGWDFGGSGGSGVHAPVSGRR